VPEGRVPEGGVPEGEVPEGVAGSEEFFTAMLSAVICSRD
jgi:hypothetical protein